MTKDEAKEKFRLADRLFAEQQFGPALKVLTELNASFPGERHVLYPMARCLAGLGRISEALDLADRVVREFNYGPAIELYRKLREMKTGGGLAALESQSDPPSLPPGAMKFDSDPIELPGGVQKFDSDLPKLPSEFDSMIGEPPKSAMGTPPPLPGGGDSWGPKAFWIGASIGAYALTFVVALTVGRPLFEFIYDIFKNATAYSESGETPGVPQGVIVAYCAVALSSSVLAYFTAVWCAYWSVAAIGASPFADFPSNMKDAAVWALIGTGLGMLPIVGWIIFLVMLKKHYDLSVGRLFGVVSLFMAFNLMISFVGGGVFWVVVISAVAS